MKDRKASKLSISNRDFPLTFIPMEKVKAKFKMIGTADIALGKIYGIAIKDEGDFVSVRLGTNELTPIGSHLHAEKNFSSKEEAFVFVEELRSKLLKKFESINTSTKLSKKKRALI